MGRIKGRSQHEENTALDGGEALVGRPIEGEGPEKHDEVSHTDRRRRSRRIRIDFNVGNEFSE
jgi:hypothetical protein